MKSRGHWNKPSDKPGDREELWETTPGTETEQIWIATHTVPGLEPGVLGGSGFPYQPVGSGTGPRGGTKD